MEFFLSIKYTQIVQTLPSSVPFVGPDAQARRLGKNFAASIAATESVFGASPKAVLAMMNEIGQARKYGGPDSFD